MHQEVRVSRLILHGGKGFIAVAVLLLGLTACTDPVSDPASGGVLSLSLSTSVIEPEGGSVSFSGRLLSKNGSNPLSGQAIVLYRETIQQTSTLLSIKPTPVATLTTAKDGSYTWTTHLSGPAQYYAGWHMESVTGAKSAELWVKQRVVITNPVLTPPVTTLEMEGMQGGEDRPSHFTVTVRPTAAIDASARDGQAQFRYNELTTNGWGTCCTIQTTVGRPVETYLAPFYGGAYTYRISFAGSDFYGYLPAQSPSVTLFTVVTGMPTSHLDDTQLDQLYRQLAQAYCRNLGSLIAHFGTIGAAGQPELGLLTTLAGDVATSTCQGNSNISVALWKSFGDNLANYLEDKTGDRLTKPILDRLIDNVLNPIIDNMSTAVGTAAAYGAEHLRNWITNSLVDLAKSAGHWAAGKTPQYIKDTLGVIVEALRTHL